MKHECDCGAVYSNLDALLACQNSNHGYIEPRSERRIGIKDRNAIIEQCARVAEDSRHGPIGKLIAAAIRAQKDKP